MSPLEELNLKVNSLVDFILSNMDKPVSEQLKQDFFIKFVEYENILNEIQKNGVGDLTLQQMLFDTKAFVSPDKLRKFNYWLNLMFELVFNKNDRSKLLN